MKYYTTHGNLITTMKQLYSQQYIINERGEKIDVKELNDKYVDDDKTELTLYVNEIL